MISEIPFVPNFTSLAMRTLSLLINNNYVELDKEVVAASRIYILCIYRAYIVH